MENMSMQLDPVAFAVFIFFFVLVTVLGFIAARWRKGNLDLLHEWGLAGRRFGTLITWFLLGGDLYTAYTFIAIPAAMYGSGAVSGFFAVPYTIIIYPLVFVLMPRFWAVCKRRGYVTVSDFVKDRFGSKGLALAVAFTGILATMPYIALQMYGIEISLAAIGVPLTIPILGMNVDIPLLIAFIVLAAYTYTSGLRAPAMIALIKDIMLFIVLFAVIAIIPLKFHGFQSIFTAAYQKHLAHPTTFSDLIPTNQGFAYSTLALGSALALFLYPHSITGVLSSSSQKVVKRNAALLPIYSLMLGFLAILGYMAIAANVKPFGSFGNNSAVPALINAIFPSWFRGFTFAAIAIGALVPAAVMSIAAANLFTRNIYKEFLHTRASELQEARMAKLSSFVVKFGALLFIIYINPAQVVFFQLLGGIWILQTLPAVFLGLFTRWFNRWALLIGWLASMIMGTGMFIAAGNKPTMPIFGIPMYTAISALVINLVLAAILTPIFEVIGLRRGKDKTHPSDYDEEHTLIEVSEKGREAFG
jgi:solute:Na+ symporter, SSS family